MMAATTASPSRLHDRLARETNAEVRFDDGYRWLYATDASLYQIDPIGVVQPESSEAERLAFRLWLLQREILRSRLLRLGIAVSRWSADAPLEVAVEEVRTFRRHARLARV